MKTSRGFTRLDIATLIAVIVFIAVVIFTAVNKKEVSIKKSPGEQSADEASSAVDQGEFVVLEDVVSYMTGEKISEEIYQQKDFVSSSELSQVRKKQLLKLREDIKGMQAVGDDNQYDINPSEEEIVEIEKEKAILY